MSTAKTIPAKPLVRTPGLKAMDGAIDYVIKSRNSLDVTRIGKLQLPVGSGEAIRCLEIKNIIEDYSGRVAVSCPLSIGVFGPPGSGKSHCVREIVGSVSNCCEPFLVNLSQLSDPKDLAEAFTKKLSLRPKSGTKVFFFDEFDAPFDGAALGWLRWFLAPMQDGIFFFNGRSTKIGKAIFVFAGGTAPSLDEFERRALADPVRYRDKKVPDFISRLRGFIDIQGINNIDGERTIRRALVLKHLLDKRWPGIRSINSGDFPIERELVRSLLSNVHFVHGARSMEALLDMCRLAGGSSRANVKLPDSDLRRLHLSRGPLDGKIIGISAGQRDVGVEDLLRDLTEALLRHGAVLAYGGDFVPDGTLRSVVDAAKGVPDELVPRSDKRIRNYLGFPSFHRRSVIEQHTSEAKYIDFLKLDTLSEAELADLRVPRASWFPAFSGGRSDWFRSKRHLAWALSLFRMRVRLTQDINALVVVGGKDDGNSWGRFSGIAEEVMLAIAVGKPVYVLGGRGGAAHAVGRLLGLNQTMPNINDCLVESSHTGNSQLKEKYGDWFGLPGYPNLPRTVQEIRSFLFARSVATENWPWNGLSLSENRQVFCNPLSSAERTTCVSMIVQGLLRLDWKIPSRAPNL